MCRDILTKLNIEYHITLFANGHDLLKSYLGEYDLILLDIIMDGISGMELARRVRAKDKNTAIIFISSSRAFALQGYDVKALHYLVKPANPVLLERLIASDYNNRIKNDYFVFASGANLQRVAIRDIVYLETVGRQVTITLKHGMIYHPGKLSDLLAKLPNDRIMRCHQSYAVNIGNIRELARYNMVTTNGIDIPVSRTFLYDVRKAFLLQLRDS